MLRATRTIALVAVAMTGLWAFAPAAQGGRRTGPIAVVACAPNAQSCSESGDVHLPANSYASQSTDTVPSRSSQATAFLEPLSTSELTAFDGMWVSVVGQFPSFSRIKSTFVRRVVTCSVLAVGTSNAIEHIPGESLMQLQVRAQNAYAVGLAVCLQVILSQPTPAIATAAAGSPCHVEVVVPIMVAKVGSGYQVTAAAGTISRPSRPAPISVSCRRKGNGLQITLRPRKRGRKLGSLLGPKLNLGFVNSTTQPVGIHTTFTFK